MALSTRRLLGRDLAQLCRFRLVDRAVRAHRDAVVGRRRVGGDEALAYVLRHRVDGAPAGIAEATAARHRDDHAILLRHGLLAHAAQGAARGELERAGGAVLAAFAAARRMIDAVVIGADGERRRVERAALHDLAQPAAELAGAAGILAVFLAPHHDR